MKKQIVISTREVIYRERILDETDTAYVLDKAREIAKEDIYDNFEDCVSDALEEFIYDRFDDDVTQIKLAYEDGGGEEEIALRILVDGGQYSIRDFLAISETLQKYKVYFCGWTAAAVCRNFYYTTVQNFCQVK